MNMNDELKQLEQATSSLPVQNLDAETAALREGWRALSASLDKYNGQFDEAALLSKLQREIFVPPQASETNGKSGGWIVVAALLGGALAASLLLMVALAGGWFGQQPIAKPTQTVPPQQNRLAASPNLRPAPAVESPSRHGINEHDGSTSTWDDPLDSQISVAALKMQTMQQPASRLDATISTLNYQLKQMAQDLDQGAL